jgi:hypothetical protein
MERIAAERGMTVLSALQLSGAVADFGCVVMLRTFVVWRWRVRQPSISRR